MTDDNFEHVQKSVDIISRFFNDTVEGDLYKIPGSDKPSRRLTTLDVSRPFWFDPIDLNDQKASIDFVKPDDWYWDSGC